MEHGRECTGPAGVRSNNFWNQDKAINCTGLQFMGLGLGLGLGLLTSLFTRLNLLLLGGIV